MGDTLRGALTEHVYRITSDLSVSDPGNNQEQPINLNGTILYVVNAMPAEVVVIGPEDNPYFLKQYKLPRADDVQCKHLGEIPSGQWETIPSAKKAEKLTEIVQRLEGHGKHHGMFRR